jgi:hypothetical protein
VFVEQTLNTIVLEEAFRLRYEIELENNKYVVDVNKRVGEKQFHSSDGDVLETEAVETGEDISYEIVKAEYDYCLSRSEKLDNKIYILLTVCAFLISVVMDIANDLFQIKWPAKIYGIKSIFECTVWVGTFLELVIFVASIIVLITALNINMDGNKELSNDELWDYAGRPGRITRDELGIQQGESDGSGVQVLNEGVDDWTYEHHEWDE